MFDRSRRWLGGLFVFACVLGVVLVGQFYRVQKQSVRHEEGRALEAIADVKTAAIAAWRRERLGDAHVLASNSVLGQFVAGYAESPADPVATERLRNWFEELMRRYDYRGVLLFDTSGQLLLSTEPSSPEYDEDARTHARHVIDRQEVVFEDFHAHDEGSVHLSVAGPLHDERSKVVGVVVLYIDPHRSLYPQVQSWPVPSETAESLLIRRDGDDVLFLNRLRHSDSEPLELRSPASITDLPAARAVSGYEGIVEGRDYRGVPVFAAVRHIPDSPWFLVAKVDASEVFARVNSEARNFAALTALSLILSVCAVALVWTRHDSQHYRELYQAETRQRVLAAKYEHLHRYANDIILFLDDEGRIIEANDRAVETYGYPRENLMALTVHDLGHPAGESHPLRPDKSIFETVHRRADGSAFPVEVSSRRIPTEGGTLWQAVIRDITERSQMEADREREHELLRGIIDNIPIMLCIYDPGLRQFELNREVERVLGWSTTEANQGDFLAKVYPDSSYRAAVTEYMQSLAPGWKEWNVTTRDATVVPSDWANVALPDGRNIGIGIDLRAKKLAELELRQTRADLQRAQAVAHLGSWRLDVRENRLVWSAETHRIFGVPEQANLTYETFLEIVHPEDRDMVHRAWEAAIKGAPYDIEHRILVNGTVKWIRERAELEFDKEGRLCGGFGTAQDITQRKQEQETLLNAHHEKERYLAQFETILEHMNEGLVVSDLEGTTFCWNPAALEAHGFASLEECRRPYTEFAGEFELFTPDGGILPIQEWPIARILRGEILRDMEIHTRVHGDDTVRIFKYGGRLARSKDGKPFLAVLTMAEITARKKAEDRVRQLNKDLEKRVEERTSQLQAANKELEAFVYSVSHDLRAPLRGIDGWSLALLEDYGSELDQEAQLFLNRVRNETQRMGALIDDLLNLSRLSRLEMNTATVDLTELAHHIAGRLKEAEPKRRIEFNIASGLSASGDAKLLEIALTNLLTNAVKFTGPRADARIEFGQTRDGEKPLFYVRDNGVGFDMVFARNLFGAFQRLHRADEFPGTGIGLATVQRVIHRHRGRIWADSKPDCGATFYFTIGASN